MRRHRPAVALHRRIGAEVDHVEIAEVLARLRQGDIGARRRRHLEHVAKALPDGRLVGLDVRLDRDGRRVGRVRHRAGEQRGAQQRHLHCRRSRMRKKRSSASMYGRSVEMPMTSTSHPRSMRSRSARAAAPLAATASRTRALPVSST